MADGSARYDWDFIVQRALAHKPELISAHLIAILGAIMAVPIPLLMPILVDEVLLDQPGMVVNTLNAWLPPSWQGPVFYISAILLLTLLLRLGALIAGVWQMRQFTLIAKDISYRIRADLLSRLKRVSLSEFETMGSATVASHLVTDLDTVDRFIGTSISKFLVAVLTIIGTASVLLWMHWQLALLILLMNPLVIWATVAMGRRVKELKRRENEAYQGFQQELSETLDAVREIRAVNRQGNYIDRVIARARAIRERSAQFAWKEDAASRLSFVIFLFGFDVFRAISMVMVLFSGLSIGEMLAVFAYLWFMMQPVQELLGIQYAHVAAKAALVRINSLAELHEEPHYPALHNPFADKDTVSIELRDLSFRYGDGAPVLDHVSLTIPEGQKVAIVGASGGGKTTLVQVLLGLYAPNEGELLFDGIPVTEIGMDVVRENVATVMQHPVLFNASVRENLSLGHERSDQQLWQALATASLEEHVRGMAEGLDTVVGRQGVRLSGGQRQRLAIARMVLMDPKVVILDEATSALDTVVEQAVHQALNEFLAGRTTLIIAHRLSAVRQAERVLVFEDGRVVEDGHHNDLVDNDGLYARLYGRQSGQ